jgi:hypothetical protein
MAISKTKRRQFLLSEIDRLAQQAIFGTLSETYRTCGHAGCRCQGPGPKHGPHLQVSYRSEKGKTSGYYVPKGAVEHIRQGAEAWHTIQSHLRELAEVNRDRILTEARRRRKQ